MNTQFDEDFERDLRPDGELSRAYRRASAPLPCAALDRRVLERARAAHAVSRMQGSGSWAYAASVLLAIAVIFAVAYSPHDAARLDDAAHFVRTAAHGSNASMHFTYPTTKSEHAGADTVLPDPHRWLERIAALRAAGQDAQADAEYRRFRAAYPAYRSRGLAAGASAQ